MSVILSDGVVTLRPRTLDDIEAQIAGQDGEIVRWLEWDEPTPANVTEMIQGSAGWWGDGTRKYDFGVRDVETDILIGNALANCIDQQLSEGQANIAYAVFPLWRGRGVAGRVVELLCDWLADDPLVHTAVLKIDQDNTASLSIANSLGFDLDVTSPAATGNLHRYVRKLANR
jgi:RimJ/RimL family protein N-acetyltransferase